MGEEIGVNVAVEYIPWDAWDQKINLKLSTKESFDLLQIMSTHAKLIADNALTDITRYIETVGKDYQANIPEALLEAAKVDGKLYIMPVYWYESAIEGDFLIRADLRDRYGFGNPKTPEELLDQLEAVMKDWEGDYKPYIPIDAKGISPTGGTRSCVLHRSYDEYPFIVKDELAIFYEDGTMGSWIESEAFKKDALFYADAYKRGLISPDILTIQVAQKNAQKNSGEWYADFGANVDPSLTGLDESVFELINFNQPSKPVMRPVSIKDTLGVPFTSKNPEAAVGFVNWLYADQANYDLFLYGIEGTHYKSLGGREIEVIPDPETQASRYGFADWMIGNINHVKYNPATLPSSVIEARYHENKNAVTHPADGFSFDGSPVQGELANVQTAIQTHIIPVYVGVVPYEEGFDDALKKVKAAGLDAVMEEYQSQYQAFLEKQKIS